MKSEVHNQDCLEAMRLMPDNAFDLAIVDPPYGIKINHSIGRRKGNPKSGHKPVTWDDSPPSIEYFDQLFRVSRNQIIWGGNYFMSKIARDTPCWLLWDKKCSDELSFAQYEMAWTSFPGSSKKIELANTGKGKIHPTQKPVQLYEWILTRYAVPGDTILDTHLGSQSSRIAAYNLGFDFCGYEIDSDYFNSGCERFRAHAAQPKLFAPELRMSEQPTLLAEGEAFKF